MAQVVRQEDKLLSKKKLRISVLRNIKFKKLIFLLAHLHSLIKNTVEIMKLESNTTIKIDGDLDILWMG